MGKGVFKKALMFLCLLFPVLVLATSNASKKPQAETDTVPSAAVVKYSRQEWRHWIDADGDGQDTRQEVLIEESLVPVVLSSDGSRVIAGLWVCPYTGETNTDPSALDVDHVVPLKNAHDTGGAAWDKEKKMEYANYLDDPDHLIAVSASANRAKGSKSPVEWMPSNEAFGREYIYIWYKIKERWGLQMDEGFEVVSNRVCR